MKKYLEARRRSLRERPRLFNQFLERLREALGDRASIRVFGGRARAGLETDEPRDYDILVVVASKQEVEEAEETVYKLKPRKLPVDVIVASKEQLENPLARQMLKDRKTLHDPLNVEQVLGEKGG